MSPTATTPVIHANGHGLGIKVGRQAAGTVETDWTFAQAHFHWGRDGHQDEGSEHYIEGVQHPLEVHYVHFNAKYTGLGDALAKGGEDALLVVGQFFKIDDSSTATMSDAMKALRTALAVKTDAQRLAETTTSVTVKPYELIDQSAGFYFYDGLFPSPPPPSCLSLTQALSGIYACTYLTV